MMIECMCFETDSVDYSIRGGKEKTCCVQDKRRDMKYKALII